jgi:hypothetical protein
MNELLSLVFEIDGENEEDDDEDEIELFEFNFILSSVGG